MRKFAVLIHGIGYDIIDEISQQKAEGFYITVFVEAKNPDLACQEAIDLLVTSDVYTAAFLPDQHPNGMLEVDTVDELTSFEGVPYLMSGFSIYINDDKNNNSNTNH